MDENNSGKGNGGPKPDKQWILAQFARRDLTQAAVAARMDIDPATLSYTLAGTRSLKLQELKRLSEILHVPAAEIMARWGYEIKAEKPTVPLKYFLRDDCTLVAAKEPFLLLPVPPGLATDSYCVQIKSSSRPNTFLNGTICFLPGGSFSPLDSLGHLARVVSTAGEAFMGVLSKGYTPDHYNITHPVTQHQVEDIAVESGTPVAWFRPPV